MNAVPSRSDLNGSHETGIAVVGIGCRLPGGVESAGDYWSLLRGGVDAITETPPGRWNLEQFYFPDDIRPGKTQSRWGGYVDGIEYFDPQLFGISPKEASSMDPQQRMLLEVAWRAMEDAGHPIGQMAGRNVSVFVGISSFDYAVAGLSYADRGVIGSYNNTGSSSSIAANRISYCFDLRGPSLAVDTACSSSLVALHLACQSLLRGESDMALCGGVNALLLPDFYVGFSQLGVLSPDGRCKTFDSRANGYVRSEGAGMVLLKPLNAAIRDRDPIYCVVRGTAINQDGHTQGLTVPSSDAQQQLVRSACQNAKIDPTAIQYVEAHGTGTSVGDPIEASALGSVLCADRESANPCLLGSVKTNIGHLEAGAGIASLIKVALSLHHRQIPAHLHLETPNPSIDLQSLRLSIPTETVSWPRPEARLLAGINGFGYGGANAHVILEAAPQSNPASAAGRTNGPHQSDGEANSLDTKQKSKAQRPRNGEASRPTGESVENPMLLPISARSATALAESATQLADYLSKSDGKDSMSDVAATAARRRGHFEYRRAILGSSTDEWADELRDLGDELRETSRQSAKDTDADIKLDAGLMFVCCGQGTQWWAMGRGIYETNATYRSTIDRCDRQFARHVDWSLKEELLRESGDSRMQQTSIAQPALFALQIALAECWADLGVLPKVVVGHSVGEIAAAYLSGALSFEDACLVAVERGRTMDLASSCGGMIAVGLTEAECRDRIAQLDVEISVAAINGPTSVTLSGAADQVENLAVELESDGVFCKRLDVEYAFHSELMAPVRDELLSSLASIRPRPTKVDLISTVTGEPIDGRQLDAEYWWRNVREGVRFADAITLASEQGFQAAIELGPHPTLTFAINECCQTAGNRIRVIPSLRRDQPDERRFQESIALAYRLGIEIDWYGIYQPPAVIASLPTYPFQRQRLWSESQESERTKLAGSHPLLGISNDQPQPVWHSRIDLGLQQIFRDHCVRGNCVLPAAAMIETAIAARQRMGHEASMTFERFQFHRAGLLTEGKPTEYETSFDADRRRISLASRAFNETDWTELATVDLVQDAVATDLLGTSLEETQARLSETFDGERCYSHCDRLGLNYGERFQGIRRGQRRDGEALAEVQLESPESFQYRQGVDPAVLDSCFHAMIVADADFDHTVNGMYLPAEIHRLHFLKPVPQKVWVHARVVQKTSQRMVADLDILDENGDPCLLIRGFLSKRTSGGAKTETTRDWLYSYRWAPSELVADGIVSVEKSAPVIWCLFADTHGLAEELATELRARGDRVVVVDHGSVFSQTTPDQYVIDPENQDDFGTLIEQVVDPDQDKSHMQLVYLWGLDAPDPDQLDRDSLDRSTILTSLAPLHLVQAWNRCRESHSSRLTVVTSGAQSADDRLQRVAVAQMPLIGFGRVIVSEYGAFRSRLVDLPPSDDSSPHQSAQLLLRELFGEDDREDEVMYRDGQRFAHRFLANHDAPLPSDATSRLQARLETGDSMGIDDLRYHAQAAIDLSPNEVEIEVKATGLNFSDVMKALHLYPSDVDLAPTLGAECAGIITLVGRDVSDWVIGDEVMAVAPGSFATHVAVGASLVARKPRDLSFDQAAALPIAFLTAAHALDDCARLREGETVLIHAASGGVGLAAMQLAKLAGLRIFATAGNDEKRKFISEHGAELVMDSRSLKFADEVMQATDGEGIDAILNSLPGEAIARGLASLKVGGRFLEIGKRDIYGDHALGMYPLRNNLAFFAIDLDQLFKTQPEVMGRKLREIGERFEAGELKPLPVKTWDVDETDSAFRFMQQAKHIGKVTVNYEHAPASLFAGDQDAIKFSGGGTYWIVGGLGGFGLEVARWLGSRGVKSLVLSGRSTNLSDEATQTLESLKSAGAEVHLLPVDATDPQAVQGAIEKIESELPPLKGVIHSAMVLEDRLLVDLDRDTLERVLRPKVLGGWNLHKATIGIDLDHFTLFSSLSSVFGHAGQANYSAANAFLDGLAHHRRSMGLPGCVINWGHLGEVGYLARREELGDRLRRQGVLSFSVEQAFKSLQHTLQNELIQTSVLRMDWSLWRGLGITGDVSPRFAHLIHQDAVDESQNISADRIREVDAVERAELIGGMLRSKVASLLGFSESQLDTRRGLVEIGLDSLMAVELRNWVENQIQVALPIAQLMRDTSLNDLVESICESVAEEETEPARFSQERQTSEPTANSQTELSRIESSDAKDLLESLPGLPQDEVTMLLTQLLREQDSTPDERP